MGQQELYEKLRNIANNPERFSGFNQILLTSVSEGRVEGELADIIATQNPLGGVHGGALYTLADTAAGLAVATNGRANVTLDSNLHFLRPPRPGKVYCTAVVRKRGRNIDVCDVSLWDSEDREVAIGTFTFSKVDRDL